VVTDAGDAAACPPLGDEQHSVRGDHDLRRLGEAEARR
jgi:hypothetical protein